MSPAFRPGYGSGAFDVAGRVLAGKRGAAMRAEARRLSDLERQDLLNDPLMADRVGRRRAARALGRAPRPPRPHVPTPLEEISRRLDHPPDTTAGYADQPRAHVPGSDWWWLVGLLLATVLVALLLA